MTGTVAPWYRTAVVYEVAVHSYQDSNGDGFGDIPGLIDRLDHLEWLGVTALWLLPLFPSPMRDGGYDITDFCSIRSDYGTVEDVKRLIDEAHRRGIRIITDFIVNHTSDEHPWFQEARQPGSPKRDWYAWSDSEDLYADARVIFVDTHDSNWTWDETAGAYYWHRFFDHQPDLNFDNPEVRQAIEDAIRFWLDLGIDGLRLDAVPYLFEEHGTSCENLEATHDYLKRLRAMVDTEYPDAILLAEANQLPVDLLPYFGDGDECHMAFHFPIMPRLFLAAHTGDARPVADILRETPELPDGGQWAVFLRNHDELTLEMVTDEERAALYSAYAPDPTMRKNVGIRRRLAPLLDDDRRKIGLLNAVLLSLPGTPVIYYGDEIAMGDIHSLDDRDGVRTPMQWDGSPTAGWSDADSANFHLPVINEGRWGNADRNVQDQRDDEGSILQFMRNLIAARAELPELGTAPYEPIDQVPDAVLAFTRGSVVVAANFADTTVKALVPASEVFAGNGQIVGDSVILPPYGWVWAGT